MSIESIRDFVRNEVASLVGKPAPEVGDDEHLVGDGAVLDSRDLVVLMIACEEHLEENYGKPFNWHSDSALSGSRSRLRTVGSLAGLVAEHAGLTP